jgi:putative ABC transport system permease protein
MRLVRAALARIAGAFTRHDADDNLRDELQAHLEMETAENIRRGMQPDEARRRAMLVAGGLTQAAEAVRDQRGLPWIEGIAADIKYALRALRHSLAFTSVVVLTLALGIGANTAIFSVVRGVLLKPLPHRGGDRLVYLRQSADGPGRANLNFSVPEVRDLRRGVPSLGGIAEYSSFTVIHQTNDGPVRINVGLVTGNYFEVMGLSPVLGRVTQPGDDGPVTAPVAVLTHEYWMTRFGGDSGIVGTTVTLNKKPVTVIGVLQPAPFFPERVAALLNMAISEHHMGASMQESRTHRMTEVVARLTPGATMAQARVEVSAVYTRLQNEFKEAYDPAAHYRVAVIPFKEVMGERARLTLWLLMASAAFVLIVSAANVANLTLMRGMRREHELVVRAALGAGLMRLRRLLLAENIVLAIFGASLGFLIAIGGVRLLTTFAERYSPRASEIRLDGVVLAFTLALSVGVALLLSFLASIPREGRIASRILAGTHRVTGSLKRQRMQRGLVVLQIAVSVVLLGGAGLLTRTMIHLSNVDTGLTSEDVLTMELTLLTRSELTDPNDAAAARFRFEQIRDEIAALPGVLAVGIGGTMPLRSSGLFNLLETDGKPLPAGEAVPRGEFRTANADYFRAAGIPLLQGRLFGTALSVDKTIADRFGGRLFATTDARQADAVIINKTLADRFFPNEDPIGKRIAWKMDWRPDSAHWQTIVGVVGNTRDGALDAEPRSVVFWPGELMPTGSAGLVIRADSRVAGLAAAATRIVRRVAPAALIEDVMTIAQYKAQTVSPRRLNAVLISSFGILAVIIAAIGIGGVLAFSVSARTNEIGIRMSLGADRGRVQRMILREGGVLLAIGLVLGVVGALFSARVIQGLLFGVAPYDPTTFIGVAVMMAAIGIIACWIPALRAARIDPAITMRS